MLTASLQDCLEAGQNLLSHHADLQNYQQDVGKDAGIIVLYGSQAFLTNKGNPAPVLSCSPAEKAQLKEMLQNVLALAERESAKSGSVLSAFLAIAWPLLVSLIKDWLASLNK